MIWPVHYEQVAHRRGSDMCRTLYDWRLSPCFRSHSGGQFIVGRWHDPPQQVPDSHALLARIKVHVLSLPVDPIAPGDFVQPSKVERAVGTTCLSVRPLVERTLGRVLQPSFALFTCHSHSICL